MKLTYWYASCNVDADVYSIIARTKREAEAERAARGAHNFEAVEKRVIEYTDGFDLFEQATGECGGRSWGTRV